MSHTEATWQGFTTHLTLGLEAGHRDGLCLPASGTRPYGGHLVAQSLQLALQDASPSLVPLSVHTVFLAIGDARIPITYRAERLRSGRSFEHWCVNADQVDMTLARSTVILHRPENGPSYGIRPLRRSSPDGSRVITFDRPIGTSSVIREGLEIRRAGQWSPGEHSLPYQDMWIRCVEPLPAGIDEVVLAWCTDLELAPTVDMPFRKGWLNRMGASLEHSIHFHNPFDVNQWWLLEQESSALSQGRGLASARAFTAEGVLIASIVQHTLLRLSLENETGA